MKICSKIKASNNQSCHLTGSLRLIGTKIKKNFKYLQLIVVEKNVSKICKTQSHTYPQKDTQR